MNGFSTNLGTNNVNKTGATNGGGARSPDRNPGQGTGAIPAVVGPDRQPIIAKTGAVNNGGR